MAVLLTFIMLGPGPSQCRMPSRRTRRGNVMAHRQSACWQISNAARPPLSTARTLSSPPVRRTSPPSPVPLKCLSLPGAWGYAVDRAFSWMGRLQILVWDWDKHHNHLVWQDTVTLSCQMCVSLVFTSTLLYIHLNLCCY